MKKQVINHLATDPEESSVTYYVRDANEAVMAIYQQTVFHASGLPGCVRKPNNPAGAPDWENDGVVEIPWSCDNCRLGAVGLIGGEWNPWQEDYDKDGLGDACDPCPFQQQPLGAPCTGLPIEFPQPEQWTGVATTTKLAELPIYGSERIGLMRPNVLRDTVIVINPTPTIFTRRVDQKEYELKDHLGNVRVVVSDMKKRVGDLTATFTLRVKSVNAYYAFGMLEEGMSGSSEGYRYGFNGKESDNEISGTGNQYDYGFRIYNPRLGKFLSVDPLTKDYPSWSPYPFAMNRPIDGIDLDGLEYLPYGASKVEFTMGALRVVPERTHWLNYDIQELYRKGIRTNKPNSLGISTDVYHFTLTMEATADKAAKGKSPLNSMGAKQSQQDLPALDPSPGAPDPTWYGHKVRKVGSNAESTGKPDRRVKGQINVSDPTSLAGGGRVLLAVSGSIIATEIIFSYSRTLE